MSTREVVTRHANENDLPVITELTRSLWLEHAANAPDLQRLDLMHSNNFAQYVLGVYENPTAKWFVATADNKVVGSVQASIEAGRNPLYVHDTVLLVDDIAVMPSARQHGVGKKLVATCRDYAAEQEIHLLQAVVYEWNGASKSLFTSMGFSPRRTDYFLPID